MSWWQSGVKGVVSSKSGVGVEAIFFADFDTPWCQFCTRMTEMSDLTIEKKLDLII